MTSGICLFIMQVNLQVIDTVSESLKDMFFSMFISFFIYKH